MGFGHILSFKVKDIPTRLAYWVLDNFDAESCEISIGTKGRVHIEAEDANRVFGFPIGKKEIKRKMKSETDELIDKWKSVVTDSKKEISPSDIYTAIVEKKGCRTVV